MARDELLNCLCLLNDAYQLAKQRRCIPAATYRLQMHANFNLKDALAIVPYLRRLGISHIYLSSILMARPGSQHGYDVMNHSRLNPELGTEADLQALVDELQKSGMGILLDIVPNHMWVGEGNQWWNDVLENGPSSRYAGFFDINWQNHPRERLRGKVLLPILNEPYGKAVQAGRFRPYFHEGCFGIAVDQTRLPLDPRTYGSLIEPAWDSLKNERGEESPELLELRSILIAIRNLAPRDDPDSKHINESLTEIQVIKRRLRELVERDPAIETHFRRSIARLAGDELHSGDTAHLAELLDAQAYRPCFWKVALDEINYRRFFEINDLAALAPERTEVFEAIHEKPFDWISHQLIDGLRIDHVDGLLCPSKYLVRLQNDYLLLCAKELWSRNQGKYEGGAWADVRAKCESFLETAVFPQDPLLFVVVEKILGSHEALPANWVCNGTTGYEFLIAINGLFVDADSAARLTEIYDKFSGRHDDFDEISFEKKLEILRSTMASELNALAFRLDRLAQMQWWSRDFTLNGIRQALEVMIACFPVYRTYVSDEPDANDRFTILRAARRARMRSPYLGQEIFSLISETLLMRDLPNSVINQEYLDCRRDFVGKFQQLTSPVMAKGVEDTAFYVYHRLVSVNEVGGDPSHLGASAGKVHEFLANRSGTGHAGLSPLSTHDTKRSEDSRVRINVLSELPDEWQLRINRWQVLNQQFKSAVEDELIAPDSNEEYLIYQSLIGAWASECQAPVLDQRLIERLQSFLIKALREAKEHSSWIHPEPKYEAAALQFLASILDAGKSAEFLDDLAEFQRLIDPIARINSLAQTLLKCSAPGIPDTYQGTESWDYCLVDPDNRRSVDYESRTKMLDELDQAETGTERDPADFAGEAFRSNCAKLYVTRTALGLRRENQDLFESGTYEALHASGPDANHVFAFLLKKDSRAILAVVPRFLGKLPSKHGSTGENLPARIKAAVVLPETCRHLTWESLFSRERLTSVDGALAVSRLFSVCPVNLLRSNSDENCEE